MSPVGAAKKKCDLLVTFLFFSLALFIVHLKYTVLSTKNTANVKSPPHRHVFSV